MKNLLKLIKAFANSNAASKFYVCATVQNTVLSVGDYNGLTWVEVGGVGSRGETGKKTNMLNYDVWGDTVIQKAKGLTDAGSPDLEVARSVTDAGQIILRAAAAAGNNKYYAFKELRPDGAVGETGTIFYNRGLVAGPTRPGGRNEDFDIEIFTLGFQQEEIVVIPTTAGTSPVLTAAPAISGTAQVGETLTCSNGTFSGDATITYAFKWFAAGTAIAGATSATFVATTAELGLVITSRVTATNASGFAYGFAAPTGVVIAA